MDLGYTIIDRIRDEFLCCFAWTPSLIFPVNLPVFQWNHGTGILGAFCILLLIGAAFHFAKALISCDPRDHLWETQKLPLRKVPLGVLAAHPYPPSDIALAKCGDKVGRSLLHTTPCPQPKNQPPNRRSGAISGLPENSVDVWAHWLPAMTIYCVQFQEVAQQVHASSVSMTGTVSLSFDPYHPYHPILKWTHDVKQQLQFATWSSQLVLFS